jgi:hypothetical protein
MDNLTNLAGATLKQQSFIADLLAQREYTLGDVTINSPKEASALITLLLAAPKKEVVKAGNPISEALSSLPCSNYAIPTSELSMSLLDEVINSDHLFLSVREYKGHKYLRRLHGSVGSFTRTKLSTEDSMQIIKILSSDPYRFTKVFGEHYKCCGKCGADLTDDKSRELMLGPVCRKEFGL